MTMSRILFGLSLLIASAAPAAAGQYVPREQDISGLRLGQRVLVDDGTCPAGQVKEVSGARMTANGVTPVRKCIPRQGPKDQAIRK